MKRLIVCCDGTWNRADQRSPTNVVKLKAAVAKRDADGVFATELGVLHFKRAATQD